MPWRYSRSIRSRSCGSRCAARARGARTGGTPCSSSWASFPRCSANSSSWRVAIDESDPAPSPARGGQRTADRHACALALLAGRPAALRRLGRAAARTVALGAGLASPGLRDRTSRCRLAASPASHAVVAAVPLRRARHRHQPAAGRAHRPGPAHLALRRHLRVARHHAGRALHAAPGRDARQPPPRRLAPYPRRRRRTRCLRAGARPSAHWRRRAHRRVVGGAARRARRLDRRRRSGPHDFPLSCRPRMRIAYLINQYPKVSHSFIRREIEALERGGVQVMRHALRGWDAELLDTGDLAEQRRTHYLLKDGVVGLVTAMARTLLRHPSPFWRTLALALRLSRRSDRPVALWLAYFAEACKLARSLHRARIAHVHAHFGTNSAAVAMLASSLGACSYSFTVHGPEEFDKPEFIHLGEKIRRARFVVAISSYGRSQLYRWVPQTQWPKVQVVRCGLEKAFHDVP